MRTTLAIIGGIVILIVAIVAVIGFSGGGGSKKVADYSADDPNAPKLETTEKRYDFGKITLQDVVSHDFNINNVGKNPLVITDLMTSCHCTTVILKVPGKADSPEFGMHTEGGWQGEVPPETEAVLAVTYEPAKHPARGPVSRVITFNSNDPSNQKVQLEVVQKFKHILDSTKVKKKESK